MNRKDKGLLHWDPEYCDEDWEHLIEKGDDNMEFNSEREESLKVTNRVENMASALIKTDSRRISGSIDIDISGIPFKVELIIKRDIHKENSMRMMAERE